MDFKLMLANTSVHRASRNTVTEAALESPQNIKTVCAHAADVSSPLHRNASMVLELVALSDIRLIQTYVPEIVKVLKDLQNETAIRCFAKVCLILSTSDLISVAQRKQLTEVCFDWLIGPSKVAVKAYALYILANFSQTNAWISDELRIIIEKDYASESPAFKAAAKKVLRQINKKPQTKQ